MSINEQTDIICFIIGRETPKAEYEILKVVIEDDDTNIDDLVKMLKDDGFVDIHYEERDMHIGVDPKTGEFTWLRAYLG